MEKYSLKLIKATPGSHQDIQSILDCAQYYYMKVEGVPRMEGAGLKVLEDLPPNRTYEDKFVFFVEKNDERIGVVDLILGYPDKKVAFIGLLLLSERFHEKGMGKESYQLVENFVRTHDIDCIQLGVNDTNEVGMKFWSKLGFRPNGRNRPNEGLKVKSTVYVMEKWLRSSD